MSAKITRVIVLQSLIAAIYATLTLSLLPISFGLVQFRISEIMLVLILLYRPAWLGLTLGCFIANIFSPLGILDIVFGTLATAITCGAMVVWPRPGIALLFPAVINGIVIGLLLYFVYDLPLVLAVASIAFGEFTVTYLPGIFIYRKLKNNQKLQQFLTDSFETKQ